MKLNTIKQIGRSDFVNMGPIKLRQPIPTQEIELIDPFVLLHHYGPYPISEFNNPFDLGPHPHRGFEPITFLIQGEQLHRDSLGNESVVEAGDVQWTTAGRGIVHAEGPTKEFIKRGGTLEGIQLWLNLPAAKKMIPANYQHVKNEDFLVVSSEDSRVNFQVVAATEDLCSLALVARARCIVVGGARSRTGSKENTKMCVSRQNWKHR
jgi:redox-sensitive bicupin YhaK (pirin superfamily)